MTGPPPWGDARPLAGCEVGRLPDPPPPPLPATRPRRPNPLVRKRLFENRFYDRLAALNPRLPPMAVAVWGWLWRCERDGLARTSVAKLADRFGTSGRTIRRALAELRGRGFLAVARRGRPGRATVYRVRATPRRPPPAATPVGAPVAPDGGVGGR